MPSPLSTWLTHRSGETHIDLDDIARIAQVGINRAYTFMSIAVSYANSSGFSEFEWQGNLYIIVMPQEVTSERLEEYRYNFPNWAVLSALREANEYFDAFLDEIFLAALMIEQGSEQRFRNDLNVKLAEKDKRFEYNGTEGKLRDLQSRFGISAAYAAEMISIRQARNCLTHRLGIVGPKDIGDSTTLSIIWRTSQIFGYNPDGSEFIPEWTLPTRMPPNSPLMMRWIQQSRSFEMGEQIILSPQELQEICFTISLTVGQIIESFTAYGSSKGVIVNRKTKEHSEEPS